LEVDKEMKISFKQREVKTGDIEVSTIDFGYMMAVCQSHQSLWKSLKEVIKDVEEQTNENKKEYGKEEDKEDNNKEDPNKEDHKNNEDKTNPKDERVSSPSI
jgi:predicted RNA-binding protein with PIN domain